MNDIWLTLMKISLVIFMAGNLLEMGLKLNPLDALKGLKNIRFISYTLMWGFVVGPGLAYVVTLVIPMEEPYAIGLILMGMTPCAPFLPMLMNRAKGDLGYTAAFMLLTAVFTIIFMPFAVPVMVKGLTITAWAIAKPLIIVILIPLVIGMLILHFSSGAAAKIQPIVKKITMLFTVTTLVFCFVVYGKGLLGVPGELAVAAQLIFFITLTTLSFWFSYGLLRNQKVVISVGLATRNIGAAFAPLMSAGTIDLRATVMVFLGFIIMVIVAMVSARIFSKSGS
jgi:bile acid:Na+ symporter, BASS family